MFSNTWDSERGIPTAGMWQPFQAMAELGHIAGESVPRGSLASRFILAPGEWHVSDRREGLPLRQWYLGLGMGPSHECPSLVPGSGEHWAWFVKK